MSDRIELRGYAIVFDVACSVGNMLEFADRRSFAGPLARRARPFLTFGSHSAEPFGQIDELFRDDFGLGFRASIAETAWRSIRWQMCSSDQQSAMSRCSIYMTDLQHERIVADGRVFHRIAKAGIQHVAIVGADAVYPDTGIWPAEVVGNLPPRLARLADKWETGFAAHRHAERGARAKALAATRARLAAAKATPRLSPDRLAVFEQLRQRAAASIATGQHGRMLFCHAAFTKVGGYNDAEFAQQIAAYRGQVRASGRCA